MNIENLNLPRKTLLEVLEQIKDDLGLLNGKKLAILGWSGFIGSWCTALLSTAMQQGLDVELILFSRGEKIDPNILRNLPKKNLVILQGNLSKSVPEKILEADHILIASTPTSGQHIHQNVEIVHKSNMAFRSFFSNPLITGRSRPLSVVHLSSGATYKCHKETHHPYLENDEINLESRDNYISAKVSLELILKSATNLSPNLRISNPRLFTFYGPNLPLTEHFAIGNFMRDAAMGKKIIINGNPNTKRSYLHVGDLSAHIIKLLLKPYSGPINLGSDTEISMMELATFINDEFNGPGIKLINSNTPPSYYVPSIKKSVEILGKANQIKFEDGIREWMQWIKI